MIDLPRVDHQQNKDFHDWPTEGKIYGSSGYECARFPPAYTHICKEKYINIILISPRENAMFKYILDW